MTGLVDGRKGGRILPAPIIAAGVMFALSLTSPLFTTDNKTVTPIATGAAFLANVWLVAGLMWLVVGAVAVNQGWLRANRPAHVRAA